MHRARALAALRALPRLHAGDAAAQRAGAAAAAAPLPACAVASSRLGGGDDARAREAATSLALWCAAALALPLAAGASAARCDAGARDGAKAAAAEDNDDTDAIARSLDAARRTLAAQLAALSRSRWPGAPPLPSPALSLRDGGRTAVLRVSLPRDADASAALLAAAAALGAGGAPLRTSASDTPAARQLALHAPRGAPDGGGGGGGGALSLLVFAPRLDVGGAALEFELSKDGALTPADVDVMARALAAAAAGEGAGAPPHEPQRRRPPPRRGAPDDDGDGGGNGSDAVARLEALGATVYPARPAGAASSPDAAADDNNDGNEEDVWGELAGYEPQKRAVEETLLLALTRPEVYAAVAAATRAGACAPNAPRGVLLAGPPGCGKTSAARALARAARVTLVYLPLEAVQSKYYGEAERNLSAVFAACDALPGRGCVLFLDELDALATRRGGDSASGHGADMHEATRRSLSVLLRRLDSMESSGKTVLVAATNRPQDLDPALVSRFGATVVFALPDARTRAAILRRYARQLSDDDVAALAAAPMEGFSGRDLRDVAEAAERAVAAAIIRGAAPEGALPGLQHYLAAAAARRAALALGVHGSGDAVADAYAYADVGAARPPLLRQQQRVQ
jgi:hypothetical protein